MEDYTPENAPLSSNGDEYTNLDLDTADELLVQAGHPSIAKALRYQTQGNRNLIQGEWGTKVVNAFENILQVHVVAALASVQQTLDQQRDLVQQILDSQKKSEKTANQALSVAKAGARGLGKITTRVDAQADQIKEIIVRLDHKREVQQAHDARLRALEDSNTRLDALEAAVRLLAGGRNDGTE
jgi:DNA repair ATPase RecN